MLARGSSVLEKGLFYGTLGTLRISRSCWSVDMLVFSAQMWGCALKM